MSEELSDRFSQRRPDANDSSHTDEIDETDNTDKTNSIDDADAADTIDDTVREREQLAMYLPPTLKEDWNSLYDEVDAKAKLAGEGGLEKNADFHEAVVEYLTEEAREDFAEYLGVDN